MHMITVLGQQLQTVSNHRKAALLQFVLHLQLCTVHMTVTQTNMARDALGNLDSHSTGQLPRYICVDVT